MKKEEQEMERIQNLFNDRHGNRLAALLAEIGEDIEARADADDLYCLWQALERAYFAVDSEIKRSKFVLRDDITPPITLS